MKDYSQNGESTILLKLFEKIGAKNKTFVDLGAGDGYHLSNTRMLKDIGWSGWMIDANNCGNFKDVEQAFITKENIITGLIRRTIPHQIDLLSIDLDGNDYHILKEILLFCKPRVIILEVNSQLPLNKTITIPYLATHKWDGSNAYGMSYNAAFKLLEENAYRVYTIVNNTNIIAVYNNCEVSPLEYTFGPTWSHPEKEIQWQEI